MESWANLAIILAVFFLIRSLRYSYLADIKEKKKRQAEAETEEPVYDSVSLVEAMFTKDEKYLLASCTAEQFQQLETTGRPVKLGYFTKEGWSGGLPFYLFKCPTCQTVSVDYKHGHRPYLFCNSCRTSVTFSFFVLASKKHSA